MLLQRKVKMALKDEVEGRAERKEAAFCVELVAFSHWYDQDVFTHCGLYLRAEHIHQTWTSSRMQQF